MIKNDHQWLVPATYLKVLIQEASATGLPLAPLFAATSLAPEELLQSESAVDFHRLLSVLKNASGLLGPGWHVSLGQRLTAPSHGPLGFAVVTAPDLRAAVDVLLRFMGIRAPFLWSTGTVEGGDYVFRFFEALDMGDQRGVLVELAALSLQAMLERPLGREVVGARLALAYPAPPYRASLERAFHAELTFDAQRHSLRFPAAWLDEPCALYDDAMHRYLVHRCEEELRTAEGGLPAAVAVRQALLSSADALPGLAEVAAAQHVSPRTLIRRLKRGNTSYRAILDDVRQTLARDYLLNSEISIAQIAWRLGYQDPSNFSRAFRQWFGVSPRHYRGSNGAH